MSFAKKSCVEVCHRRTKGTPCAVRNQDWVRCPASRVVSKCLADQVKGEEQNKGIISWLAYVYHVSRIIRKNLVYLNEIPFEIMYLFYNTEMNFF